MAQAESNDLHGAIAGLGRLTDLFQERRRRLAREAGLSEAQWRLLEEIAGEEFMPSLFARRRACTPAAISRTLRGLLEQGLVSVEISAADARQRVYRLTPRGRAILEQLEASRARAIAAVWSQFTPDELAGFRGFTSALCDSLERYLGESSERS